MKKLTPIILAVICAVGVPSNAMANESGKLYYENEDNKWIYYEQVDVEIEPITIVYDGTAVQCSSFKVSGVQYIQLRQLVEQTGKTISYNPITKSVIITDSKTEGKAITVKEGQAVANLVEDTEVYCNNIKCELRNENGGAVYNVDGYLYCELDGIINGLKGMYKQGDITANIPDILGDNLVEYKNDMGLFYLYGKGYEKHKSPTTKKCTQEIISQAERSALLKIGRYPILEDKSIKTYTVFGQEAISVTLGWVNSEAMLKDYIYMPIDGTEGSVVLEKGNINADDKLELIDLGSRSGISYFLRYSFEYTGTAMDKSRLENAKSMSRAVYDSEYKVLEQWSVPFIYEDRHDNQIYEVVLVENLLEAPDGTKCLKESFFKVEDFVNKENKLWED